MCGKPGCSKTMSVQLTAANLRGTDSQDPFFKSLPRLLMITYQGSEASTSQGIEKTFQKAVNLKLNAKDKNLLPIILFDEIGLAEISPFNPLKVLHAWLEPEKPLIGFVGISNWRLDASKMNRAIYITRPDPTGNELELTAEAIF